MAAAQPASREGAGPQSHGQPHRPTTRRGGDGDGGQVGRGGQQQGTGGQNEEAFLPSLPPSPDLNITARGDLVHCTKCSAYKWRRRRRSWTTHSSGEKSCSIDAC